MPFPSNQSAATIQSAPSAEGCYHCGASVSGSIHHDGEKTFCCAGCLGVYRLILDSGLAAFYRTSEGTGIGIRPEGDADRFQFLDDPDFQEQWLDFKDDQRTKVSFRLPAIHCVACVWLLENLYRIEKGIGRSTVDFAQKRLSLEYDHRQVRLSGIASRLASLGYEPDLNYADLHGQIPRRLDRRRWIQIGVAGFAFGNIMLFSLPGYTGLDHFNGPEFVRFFNWLSLALATPVLLFSAADYWKAAWVSLSNRLLSLDVPIALGMAGLFSQSVFDIALGRGEGYLDSLTGLVFFLLCGRSFQEKTYDRLSFDLDYKSFLPLSVTRKSDGTEERVVLDRLKVGDVLVVRHGELIPVDARLEDGSALIDYSFVTGESDPVFVEPGGRIFAGGRQAGGIVEVKMIKPLSEGRLIALWNQDVFKKDHPRNFSGLLQRFGRWFTVSVLAVAAAGFVAWLATDPSKSVIAFVSVLIVACPCALALSAPFTFGTALRVLEKIGIFIKEGTVLEKLAGINAVVFDKTGTLTSSNNSKVTLHGAELCDDEARLLYSVVRHSTHPFSVRIHQWMNRGCYPEPVTGFHERPGYGLEAWVRERRVCVGSSHWLQSKGVRIPNAACPDESLEGSLVHLAIDGVHRAAFSIQSGLRSMDPGMWERLGRFAEVFLLSGDRAAEADRFLGLFKSKDRLRFNQSPQDKLTFVKELGIRGKQVMMVGDGLNDAGALKQSHVGVAVTENTLAFCPSSDVILFADKVVCIDRLLSFSKAVMLIVKLSLGISLFYNLVGIGFALTGELSPVVCAILMPISSVTVLAFAVGATWMAAWRHGLAEPITAGGRPWV